WMAADPASLAGIHVTAQDDRWKVSFTLTHDAATQTLETDVMLHGKQDLTVLDPEVTAELNDPARLRAMFALYQDKLKKITGILKTTKAVLHANRNLCEDFLPLETVCSREIALCADIDVEAGADIEQVYARVL